MNKSLTFFWVMLGGLAIVGAGSLLLKDKIVLNENKKGTIHNEQVNENTLETLTNTPTEVIERAETVTNTITSTPFPKLKDFSMNLFNLHKKIVGKLYFKYSEDLKVKIQEYNETCSNTGPGCLPYYISQAVVFNKNGVKLEIGTYNSLEVSCVPLSDLKSCSKITNDIILITNQCYNKLPSNSFTYARIFQGSKCNKQEKYVLFLGDVKLSRGILFSDNESGAPVNVAVKGTVTGNLQTVNMLNIIVKTAKVAD